MPDFAFGQAEEFVTTTSQTPAQVYFFHVGKETSIQTAYFTVFIQPDKQRSSCCPKNRYRCVILSFVFFYDLEDTPATERIAVAVDKPSGRSGIFKTILLLPVEQFRLTRCYILMKVHIFHHRSQPAGSNFNVAVEQYRIFGINLFESLVVAVGKAVIPIQTNQTDCWKLLLQYAAGVIGRPVVRYAHFYPLTSRTSQHGRQKATKHFGSVPVQDDYRNLVHIIVPFSAVPSSLKSPRRTRTR